MNGRLKKKSEKRERLRIHRMLEIALRINGLEAREVEKTGSLPTAFFGFSGHIGTARIYVYTKGWGGHRDPDITIEYATAKWLKSTYPYPDSKIKQLEQQVKKYEI